MVVGVVGEGCGAGRGRGGWSGARAHRPPQDALGWSRTTSSRASSNYFESGITCRGQQVRAGAPAGRRSTPLVAGGPPRRSMPWPAGTERTRKWQEVIHPRSDGANHPPPLCVGLGRRSCRWVPPTRCAARASPARSGASDRAPPRPRSRNFGGALQVIDTRIPLLSGSARDGRRRPLCGRWGGRVCGRPKMGAALWARPPPFRWGDTEARLPNGAALWRRGGCRFVALARRRKP